MRVLKWVLLGLGLLALAGTLLFLKMKSKMRGPPVPICKLPVPPRVHFEAPKQVSSDSTPGARLYDIEPAAALLPDGALSIAFNPRNSFLSGDSGLVTARIGLDGAIQLAAYPTARKHVFDAWMDGGGDGKLRMVWLGHDGGRPEKNMTIGYAESSDGLHWSAASDAYAPADCPPGSLGCMDKPMIATSSAGVHVFYFSQASHDTLRVTTAPYATPPRFTTSIEGGDAAYGGVVVDGKGRIHVVYTTSESGPENEDDPFGAVGGAIGYRISDDGGKSFKPAIIVSKKGDPVPFYFSNPRIAVDDARGLLYVVYPMGSSDGRWEILLATSSDAGKSWSRIKVNDDAPCANHMTPHLALDPASGTVHVTWLENRSGSGALAYAACEPGGQKCGANESVSAAPFLSYSFERHLPAWLSEYGSLVLDPKQRWLHAVWTQPVEEHGEPVSRIFWARMKLP
jgi:hypothetical protein